MSRGRAFTATVLSWWIRRSSLHYGQFSAMADWGVGEPRWLINSQISHLRNGNIRQPGFQNLEALSAVNELVWHWQTKGGSSTFARYGPFPDTRLDEEVMGRTLWLHHPETEQPLVFHDFCDLFVGRLELPYIDMVTVNPRDARQLSQELSALLDQLVIETGLGVRGGLARLMEAYPVLDKTRRERLRSVALGTAEFTAEQLEEELFAISELVRSIRGLSDAALGPRELYAELTSHRRRT